MQLVSVIYFVFLGSGIEPKFSLVKCEVRSFQGDFT